MVLLTQDKLIMTKATTTTTATSYRKGDLLWLTENGSEPILVACHRDQISPNSKKLLVYNAPNDYSLADPCWVLLSDLSPAPVEALPILEAIAAVEAEAPAAEAPAVEAVEAEAPAVEAVEAEAPAAEAPAVEAVEAEAPAADSIPLKTGKRALFRANSEVFWAAEGKQWHYADVYKSQRRTAKQVKIIDLGLVNITDGKLYRTRGSRAFDGSPFFVRACELFTGEEFKEATGIQYLPNYFSEIPLVSKKAPAPIVTAPAPVVEAPAPIVTAPAPVVAAPAPVVEAPAPIVEGQWLYWTAKPGDVRVVQCVVTPRSPQDLVWVRDFKNGLFVDKFTARPEALDTIDHAEVIEEAKRLEAAYYARIDAEKLKKEQEYKEELQQGYLAQFTEAPAELDLSFNSPKEFADKMEQLETPDKIKALCDRLMALPRFSAPNLKPRTVMQRLGEYNKAVTNMCVAMGDKLYSNNMSRLFNYTNRDGSTRLRHLYFKYVGVADFNWDAHNKQADSKLVNRLENQTLEIDSDRYIEAVKDCLISDNPHTVLAGLLADSGRRPIEIIELGTFSPVEDDPKMLLFSGQAKKRGKEIEDFNIILLHTTSDLFLARLKWAREHELIQKAYKGLDPNSSDFLKRLSDRVTIEIVRKGIDQHFNWLPPRADEKKATCRTLRSVWAALVADRHCPQTTNKLLYASRLLGHFEQDPAALLTTLGYSDINVKSKGKDTLNATPAPAESIAEPIAEETAPEVVEEVAAEDNTPSPAGTVKIKALTLHQPWAELMIEGLKLIETRNWGTKYRGPIAIHAADKKVDPNGPLDLLDIPESEYIRGAIVAIAHLSDCVLMDEDFIAQQSELEKKCGLWEVGRYAWIFSKFEVMSPMKAKGNRRLWNWDLPAALNVNLEPETVQGSDNAASPKTCNLVDNGITGTSNGSADHDVSDNVTAQPGLNASTSSQSNAAADSVDNSGAVPLDADINVINGNINIEPAQTGLIESTPHTYAQNSYLDFVENSQGRHPHDFYETPDWLPVLMLEQLPISGTVGEPAAGYGAISNVFKMVGLNVWTSDLDTEKPADYHGDATSTEYWQSLPEADWIVTNPPFSASAAILEQAYKHAKRGVVLVLPIAWFEVCKDRVDFLKVNPPTTMLNVPRYCYKKGSKSEKWATDKGPAIAYVWDKQSSHLGLTKILSFAVKDIPLYYRTPEQRFTPATVKTMVDRVMAERKKIEVKTQPETATKVAQKKATKETNLSDMERQERAIKRIDDAIQPFLDYNSKLAEDQKWYVSQTIVARVAQCNNDTANLWINVNKAALAKCNQGLNRSTQNRGREFSWPI